MSRQYELILFGATGYTGKYCAEHITAALPTDLKWAVAGRNASKLAAIVHELKKLNADRDAPSVETCSLEEAEIDAMTKKAKMVINCVGPYHLYGTKVIKACARNGTHYIDATGETPWVKDMIKECHDLAVQNNAILIPQCGLESCPPDLLAYSIATYVRKEFNSGTKDVLATIYKLVGGVSGGTFTTAVTLSAAYSLSHLAAAIRPFALSPVPHGAPSIRKHGGRITRSSPSLVKTLTGTISDPYLGVCTTGPQGALNGAIVGRSWGLHQAGRLYGEEFSYEEFWTVAGIVTGMAQHWAIFLAMLALSLAPVRWLAIMLGPKQGDGPERQSTKKDRIEMRAVAKAESGQGVRAKLTWEGSMYHFTGVSLGEGARVILRGKGAVQGMRGGVLTPSCLGEAFVEALDKQGMAITVEKTT